MKDRNAILPIESGNLDRLKTPLVRKLEAQERKFTCMEFSALVHQESFMLNASQHSELRKNGANYVIDTVLESHVSAQEVVAALDRRA